MVNEWRDRVQALEEQLRLAQRGSGTRRDQRFDTLYEHFTGHRAQQRVWSKHVLGFSRTTARF